ncbi:HD family phosphohydrolase [Selenihalanaerobacter shriftii]|uniref:HD/PDEase domain-containing protein n=1 Tax=Selenihalanaerobacter shriftii TaxID=142842 RepID=A0A1T4PXS3_9FIRM|nr:HDIG domain-containing metalloprotein [Selenihalanaerobacter shriftii]SJZ96293.1 hypothetical protein SAMN02745118_02350 [Selenihalanaerobacter shriftii]
MGFLDEMKEKISAGDLQLSQDMVTKRWIWGIVVFIILTLILTIDFIPNQVNLEVGQVSPRDIEAPKTIEYIDEDRTEELKLKAAESVPKVYEEDVTVLKEVRKELNDFFTIIKKYSNIVEVDAKKIDKSLSLTEKISEIQGKTAINVTDNSIRYLLKANAETLNYVENKTENILTRYLSRGIKSDAMKQVKEQIEREVQSLSANNRYRHVIDELIQNLIRPNLILDKEATTKRREEAKEAVKPVKKTIHQGQVIIRYGKVVVQEDIKVLKELGLRHKQVDFIAILGLALIVFIFVSVFVIYVSQYKAKIVDDEGVVALLGILPILMLLFAKIMTFLELIDNPAYLVPVAGLSMLLAILVDYNLSIMATMALSFLVTLVTGAGVAGAAVALVGGLVGIYSVSKVTQRNDLVRAGFYVSGASVLTILAFELSAPPVEFLELLKSISLGIINGIIVGVVTNGFLPYLENTFGITSPVKLLELSNPNNQPLLKKLMVEAPSTYQHSTVVGNLAEAAADAVDADALLVRVGAYYHDIGKIKRPYFFTENQFSKENPHDKLSPNLSTLIITSHVKDGVELAKKYGLPNKIIDIIRQHHAKSLVSFFYQEALHDDKYENVNEEEFRYPGPKPQTKESAIIMLADITEAATRSKVEVHSNPGKLEVVVRELIRNKLDEGQLDESDLTLKDLDKIGTAFVNVLTGRFHNRVEYPEHLAEEMKGEANSNENSN